MIHKSTRLKCGPSSQDDAPLESKHKKEYVRERGAVSCSRTHSPFAWRVEKINMRERGAVPCLKAHSPFAQGVKEYNVGLKRLWRGSKRLYLKFPLNPIDKMFSVKGGSALLESQFAVGAESVEGHGEEQGFRGRLSGLRGWGFGFREQYLARKPIRRWSRQRGYGIRRS